MNYQIQVNQIIHAQRDTSVFRDEGRQLGWQSETLRDIDTLTKCATKRTTSDTYIRLNVRCISGNRLAFLVNQKLCKVPLDETI